MNVAMEEQNQTVKGSNSPTPDVLPPQDHDNGLPDHTNHLGTVIPNRIFVGGVGLEVSENQLQRLFSQHGAVKDVNIVVGRSGEPKGYGFVTFERREDAQKLLQETDMVCLKNKRLCIGQAFRRLKAAEQTKSDLATCPGHAGTQPVSSGPLFETMFTGCPYSHHSRGTYFHCPSFPLSHPPYHWRCQVPPMVFPVSPQLVYQQPACHCYQCVPTPYQWNAVQPPMPSGPVVYSQHSHYLYRPTDGGLVQPPVQSPVTEHTTPENQMFSHPHAHLRPKYNQQTNQKDCYHLPEATDPLEASVLHASQAPK